MYTRNHNAIVRARRARPMGDDQDGLAMVSSWFDDVLSADKADPTDNVNETTGGGTSTSVSDFVAVGGVCKPRNFPALYAVKELQNQLNRVAQMKGFGKIPADDAACFVMPAEPCG